MPHSFHRHSLHILLLTISSSLFSIFFSFFYKYLYFFVKKKKIKKIFLLLTSKIACHGVACFFGGSSRSFLGEYGGLGKCETTRR